MKSTLLLATALAVAAPALAPAIAHAQSGEQDTVDRATIALQEMMTTPDSRAPENMLKSARAVLECPRVFKAGFFFGGSGGNCLLLARAGNGTWSYPAFYQIGSASFGLQIGVQDSALTLLVMTNRGLNALLNTHFKFGAGASLAIATVGGGAQGAVTPGSADIVAFESARGLFAGISLEGSVLNSDTGADRAYYRAPLDARQIVVYMRGANPGADPLRGVLTRYGTPTPAYAPPPPYGAPGYAQPGYGPPPRYAPPAYAPPASYQPGPGYGQPPGYAPSYPPAYTPPGGYAPAPGFQSSAPIEQQNLPPPR